MKRTNDELADALRAVTQPNYVLGVGDVYRINEAADVLAAMPEGERIEGFVPNWPATNGVPRDEFVEIHFERKTAVQGDQNVARATLILHTTEGGD